jgi:Cytochrome b(N-terminal)/b6/petB
LRVIRELADIVSGEAVGVMDSAICGRILDRSRARDSGKRFARAKEEPILSGARQQYEGELSGQELITRTNSGTSRAELNLSQDTAVPRTRNEPLVGGPVCRGDNPAAAAGVLPRPVLRPGAARLADLGGAAAAGHARGLHRHHLARRRAVRGSLSVTTGVLLSVPVIGTHLVFWIFGGAPPGHQIIGRDYWVHILVLPALAGALLLASFRPSLRRPLRPRVDPLLLFTCAVLVLLGTIAQINPVWLIGPYQPVSISAGAAPDWYMGFLDGALRVMPAWELPVAGHPLDLGVLIPGLVVPALFFTCLALYPAADRRIAGGRPPRGLLPPRPADPANRTAAGVAGVTFYGLLWAAAANDQIAYHLQIPLYTVTWIFRVLVLAGPVLAFLLTRGICHALAGRRREEELHARPGNRADRAEPARRL